MSKQYMTMREAFECDDNDIPFIEGEYNCNPTAELTKAVLKKNFTHIDLDHALSKEWRIKKAEPKVLTAEELVDHHIVGEPLMATVDFAELCDKNGQLKQWLNHKELRESFLNLLSKVKLYMEEPTCNDFLPHVEYAEKALKNLKPPN